MSIEGTTRENTNLVKIIKNVFFIPFLPDSQKTIDEISEDLKGNKLDLDSLFSTENEETKEFLRNFLPKDIDIFEDKKVREAIITKYESDREKYKYGLPQVIIETFYDSRFRDGFDKRAGNVLKTAREKNPEDYKSFDLIPDFMERISDAWQITDKNEKISTLRKSKGEGGLPFVSLLEWNDFSTVTNRKFIGQKVKNAVLEPIDNMYSAFKVFGQGEYSKMLISCKNKKQPSIHNYINSGLNVIYQKLNDKYHIEENTTTDLIQINFKMPEQDALINKDKIDKDKYQYEHQKHFHITEAQIVFINDELQRFYGDYVPVCLEDIYKSEKKDNRTLSDYLYENCKQLIRSTYKKHFDYNRYSNGLPFEKDEVQFINKFFNAVADYRQELSYSNRKIFDNETVLKTGESFELPAKFVKTFDKMNLLERLESVSERSEIFSPLKDWFEKKTWKSLKQQRSIDQSESFQETVKVNIIQPSDDMLYKGGVDENGQKYSGTYDASEFTDVSGENAANAEEYADELNEGYYDENIEEVNNDVFEFPDLDTNTAEPECSMYLIKLFYEEFYEDLEFIEIMKKIIKKQIKLEEALKPEAALYYLFEKCDRVHSYSSLWTYYKNTADINDEISELIFRDQMKKIRNDYIQHYKIKSGDF